MHAALYASPVICSALQAASGQAYVQTLSRTLTHINFTQNGVTMTTATLYKRVPDSKAGSKP